MMSQNCLLSRRRRSAANLSAGRSTPRRSPGNKGGEACLYMQRIGDANADELFTMVTPIDG